MRRSPIKRGDSRLTADPEKTRLWQERSKPMARKEMTRGTTRKKDAYEARLDELTPALLERSKGACEVRWPGVCTGNAVHRHHRKMGRGRGSQDGVEDLLHVCYACHSHLHLHPKTSYTAGYLVSRYRNAGKVPVSRLRKVA